VQLPSLRPWAGALGSPSNPPCASPGRPGRRRASPSSAKSAGPSPAPCPGRCPARLTSGSFHPPPPAVGPQVVLDAALVVLLHDPQAVPGFRADAGVLDLPTYHGVPDQAGQDIDRAVLADRDRAVPEPEGDR